MLGLLALGLTTVMIYTLVKNALVGTQLASGESFNGTVEIIIPIKANSEFYLEPWIKNLNHFKTLNGNVKIHILIDGHHPAMIAWQELHQKLPYVELHSYLTRPLGREPLPWMIEQISSKIQSNVVIIADAELVPDEDCIVSLSKLVSDKSKPYFVLPQTAKINFLGEAIAVINPTLALASVFGFRKFRRNVSHPLMSIAQGWLGMPLETFQKLDFTKIPESSWKEGIARLWDQESKSYLLAFGEKHLIRYYPEDVKVQIYQMKTYWDELWRSDHKVGLGLYVASLFIWSFPIICFISHPFWALASICLLVLYRFFSKIVFQETWAAAALHPIGCMVWLGTLIWWGVTGLKAKLRTSRPA